MSTSTRGTMAASAGALLIFLAIYGPSVGLGFISDDYVWIRHGQVHTPADVGRVFSTSVGLYRPLVSLSFGLNYAISGLSPRPFGFTNLAMALACAAGIWRLGRELRLSSGIAATAAALWAFNFHGINMGVLWLSGRSGLMLTMFGVLAGIGFLRGRMVWATLATLAAAFSKEEGAMLPVLFTLWAVIASSNDSASDDMPTVTQRVVTALRRTWPIWAAVAVVLASRLAAGGFFPTNAPDFYTPVFGPLRLLRNVLEYADRSLTFAAAAVLLTWLWTRHRPQPTAHDRYVLRMAAVWFICGFALNVFLPVRSSLYAMFPGVGSALAAATCIGMFTRTLDSRSRQRLAWAGVVLLAMLSPVYLTRNVRWTELARLSASVVAQIRRAEPYLPNGSTLVIADDITTRANLRNAWAGPVYEVAAMEFGNRLTLIVPEADAEPCCPDAVHVTLRDGVLHGLPSLR